MSHDALPGDGLRPVPAARAGRIAARDLLTLLVVEAMALVAGTMAFVVLFRSPLLAGIVFFYRGIALLVVATLITTIALIVVRRWRFPALIGWRDVVLVGALLFSGNLLFFTHVPVTADRSISVFMLGYLEQQDAARSREEIETVLVGQYLVAGGAAEKRIQEQIASGNLVDEGGRYRITDQGRALMAGYRATADVFGIDPRNVDP